MKSSEQIGKIRNENHLTFLTECAIIDNRKLNQEQAFAEKLREGFRYIRKEKFYACKESHEERH